MTVICYYLPGLYPSAYLSESRSANRVPDCRVQALAHLEEKKYIPRIKFRTDLLIGSMGCFCLSGLGGVCAVVLAGVAGLCWPPCSGLLCSGLPCSPCAGDRSQAPANCWLGGQFWSGKEGLFHVKVVQEQTHWCGWSDVAVCRAWQWSDQAFGVGGWSEPSWAVPHL